LPPAKPDIKKLLCKYFKVLQILEAPINIAGQKRSRALGEK
jgi:hypothetical protein